MFNQDIVKLVQQNKFFRQEVKTGPHSQVVLMSLKPGEEIGMEVHDVDQILVFVKGEGEAVLNDEKMPVAKNNLVFVPAGTNHNFINTGKRALKLYTIYSPPEHKPGTVHKTKKEAERAEKKGE